jgi:hypothetical protein
LSPHQEKRLIIVMGYRPSKNVKLLFPQEFNKNCEVY